MNFLTTINPESKSFLPNGTDTKPLVSKGFLFMEIWKNIVGYEGYYQVSNYGRIKSLPFKNSRNRIFRLSSIDNCGYVHVSFHNPNYKSFLVHRLVAISFIPNPENKPEVNHKDFNKINNCADNLEWATKAENMYHAAKNGLINTRKGEKSNFAKITQRIADNIRHDFDSDVPRMAQYKILSDKYLISERQVRYIISGLVWV